MENRKKKSLIYPTVFMIILTAILTFILAVINQQTKPIVAQNRELDLKEKILYVFSIEHDNTPEGIIKTFDEKVKVDAEKFNDEPVYVYEVDNKVEAYAFAFNGSGLWGPVKGYMGIKSDLSELVGIDFIEQQETPGLGGRIAEEFYKSQYRGAHTDNLKSDIDAISGATLTSNAVINLVDEDLQEFLKIRGGSN